MSDHYNGKKFVNLGIVREQSFKDVWKWMRNREKSDPWQEKVLSDSFDLSVQQVPDSSLYVTFINHSTVLIQLDGYTILTDPIWSKRCSPVQFAGPKRMRPPGISYDKLPPINMVLISHDHYDHLDKNTVKKLWNDHHPLFIVPLGVKKIIEGWGIPAYAEMDWWQKQNIDTSMSISCVPAQHFSGRGMFNRNETLWCGYVLHTKAGNIYFAGDSGYGSLFKKIGEIFGSMTLSLIPIGAYKPQWFMSPIHISPEEAVMVHQDVKSKTSIAIHYGTFPMADDGQNEPIEELIKQVKKHELLENSFLILQEGKPFKVSDF